MFDMSEKVGFMMQELMQRFQKVLAKVQMQHADVVLQLNAGASVAQLQDAQTALDVVFPDALQALYAAHNGQTSESQNVLNGAPWLSLAQMVALTQKMHAQTDTIQNQAWMADDEVQALWWHQAWLPLAANHGEYVCVDLAPTEDGDIGQIILVSNNQLTRTVLADSLPTWLDAHIEALEQSDYVYSAAHGGIVDAEVLFAEDEDETLLAAPVSKEQWHDMEADLQQTLNDLLGEGAPDLQQLVQGLMGDDEIGMGKKALKESAQESADFASFKALFDDKRPENATAVINPDDVPNL